MKIIQISISKQEILENVALQSAYTGEKASQGAALFQKVATVNADNSLLLRLFDEMAGQITDRLKNFIVECENDESGLALKLELSGAYDDALTPSVKSDLFAAFAAGVVYRWLSFSFPDRAPEWAQKTDKLLERVFTKLYNRRKPTRI